jgi:AraC-like DNA-binding protein
MPGVRVCNLSCAFSGELLRLSVIGRYETLFCQNGSLRMQLTNGHVAFLRQWDILLLSDASNILSVDAGEGQFQGILIVVDGVSAHGSLARLQKMLGGLPLDPRRVGQMMHDQGGVARISGEIWSETLFTMLEQLPEADRGQYCALKAVELLYLLCSGCLKFSQMPSEHDHEHFQTDVIHLVHDYIHTHLDEKLSIENLAEQFHLSPSELKLHFRRIYGKPLHQYISSCRMERATELLTSTALTVAQVAAAVGYGSTSHFNAAFQKQYQSTPAQYRKQGR